MMTQMSNTIDEKSEREREGIKYSKEKIKKQNPITKLIYNKVHDKVPT